MSTCCSGDNHASCHHATCQCHDTPTDDGAFEALTKQVSACFSVGLEKHGPALFTTDVNGLFELFIGELPADERQHHTCNSCRRFIENYGNLVFITEAGATVPAMWLTDGDVPAVYAKSIRTIARAVAAAKVTGVFVSEDKKWGQPITGDWTHIAIVPPSAILHRDRIKTPFQVAAEKREDHGTVLRALSEFTIGAVRAAVGLLDGEALYRAEKVAGPARWLLALHETRATARGRARDALTWRAIALAPSGFCHPRSSMVGTLLEDLAANMDFADVKRRFDAKMDALQYQRPQAAPDAGNVLEAEKIIAKLGCEASLRRRFARFSEIQTVWTPKPKKAPAQSTGGVFGEVKVKKAGKQTPDVSVHVTRTDITWDKFVRTVLSKALSIELLTKTTPDSYAALVTAVDPDAPPILQWDSEELRNPVSWYLYGRGSLASTWGLRPGTWVPVTAVAEQPSMWNGDRYPHQGKGAFLLLDGARDQNQPGACLFPEILRSEFRAVRATIEAYCRTKGAKVEGGDEASACGIKLASGSTINHVVRVTTETGTAEYRIDRWD